MSSKVWSKLELLKERLLTIHETKGKVMKLDDLSATLPNTINHMLRMYPNTNTIGKRRMRM